MRTGKFLRTHDRLVLTALLLAGAVCAALMLHISGLSVGGVVAAIDSVAGGAPTGARQTVRPSGNPRGYSRGPIDDTPKRQLRLVEFDPNTADSTTLTGLGLAWWEVRRIYRYRNKGGVFYDADAFLRLANPSKAVADRIRPYIRISSQFRPVRDEAYYRGDTIKYPVKIGRGQTIELNSLDTTLYKKIPGIGTFFAGRIADYGRRLGGYRSIGQLEELDIQLPEKAVASFRLDTTRVRRINLNTETIGRMARHPYIGYFRAKAIADYRKRHGRIDDIDRLRTARDFDDMARARMKPYICY